jgi:hypothetical protein
VLKDARSPEHVNFVNSMSWFNLARIPFGSTWGLGSEGEKNVFASLVWNFADGKGLVVWRSTFCSQRCYYIAV